MKTLTIEQTTSRGAFELLANLCHKIVADGKRGTPIHPKGHEDCAWGKEGYPQQYMNALEFLAGHLPWAREALKRQAA
jgi:hypothetical protein